MAQITHGNINLNVRLVEVTPELARTWLKRNKNNRPLRYRRVSRYAESLRAGKWMLNGETIIFSTDGFLLNGQHRLEACAFSGVSFVTLVVEGIEPEAFLTMDDVAARSAADIMAGDQIPNSTAVSSASKVAICYISGQPIDADGSRQDITLFPHRHPDIVKVASMVKGAKLELPASVTVAALFLANALHSGKLEPFIEGLRTGAGLEYGDPRLTLRSWVHSERRKRRSGTLEATITFGAVVRSWNAWANDKTITVLRSIKETSRHDLDIQGFRRESYPDVPEHVPSPAPAHIRRPNASSPKGG